MSQPFPRRKVDDSIVQGLEESPPVSDDVYDMILKPDLPPASEPINIPPRSNLSQSMIFADLRETATRLRQLEQSRTKYH